MRSAAEYQTTLERKLGEMFPSPENRRLVEEALSRYRWGKEFPGLARVHLAILKLAGTDLDKVEEYVEAANGDPRDVLYWAEYPNQAKGQSWRLPEEEREKLIQADLDQYETWIESGESSQKGGAPGS